MKKIIFTMAFIFPLLIASQLFSQINWVPQSSGTLENLNGIHFVDPNYGFAVGNNGVVKKTTNAGLNWNTVSFPVTTNNLCVFFTSYSTGYIGNSNFSVYKTTNGGLNWTAVPTGSNYAVKSLYFLNDQTGWLGDFWGNIKKTVNGGINWTQVYLMPGYDSKVFAYGTDRIWAVDNYGYCAFSVNNGANFTNVRVMTDTLSGVKFVSSTLGFVCGDSGRVFKTVNGGSNWARANTGTAVKLNHIEWKSPSNIWIAGNNGTILSSANYGTSWSLYSYGSNNLKSIDFPGASGVPGSSGFAAGDFGTILRSDAFSYNSCIGSDTIRAGYPFYTFYMDSRTQMLYTASEILGNGGLAGNITKIGFNVAAAVPQTMNGFKIKMKNTSVNTISAFDNTGMVIVYEDAYSVTGTGWRYIELYTPFFWDGVSNLLIEVCFNNSSFTTNSYVFSTSAPGKVIYGYQDLTSGDGCIDINTSSGVITGRPNLCIFSNMIVGTGNPGNNLPAKYSLHQNYPNPFNPVTKISYELPKNGFTVLKVYNLLGREVRTLVNETKNAGRYSVDFNASELSSGVYFYTLRAGDFYETKKMMLVK